MEDKVLPPADYAQQLFDEFVRKVEDPEVGVAKAKAWADRELNKLVATMPSDAVRERVSLLAYKLDKYYRDNPNVAHTASCELTEGV